jgi:uncharacterized protein
MSVALLDVSFLVSLHDRKHPVHETAHRWFGLNEKRGWATCPLTINGCIRVLSNPRYSSTKASPLLVAERLREMCSSPHHHFWHDSISMTDPTLFRLNLISGHLQVTDTYLLALAVRNHGRLVTFDRGINPKAVIGATPGHLVVL